MTEERLLEIEKSLRDQDHRGLLCICDELIDELSKALAAASALTDLCRNFDKLNTWHWQCEGQRIVPGSVIEWWRSARR